VDQHLAFGKGLHYCLGANLGRLEAQMAITQLAGRYPHLQLTVDRRLTFPRVSRSAARRFSS
jgi:cytochrome P450